jgi:hypothetical protein
MTMKITLLAVGLAGLLGACASTTKYQDYPEPVANAPSATVHVVRANAAFGAAVTAPVYVNRYLIGRVGPGGYISTKVPAGPIHVTSTTADSVVQAEAGKAYFFEVSMPGQMWMYAPDFIVTRIEQRRAEEVAGSSLR